MTAEETIRAWKDPEYRETLAESPPNPAGVIELDDEDLGFVTGGRLNSGTRNRRWPGTPSKPEKPDKPVGPEKRWRKHRPRPSVKR